MGQGRPNGRVAENLLLQIEIMPSYNVFSGIICLDVVSVVLK